MEKRMEKTTVTNPITSKTTEESFKEYWDSFRDRPGIDEWDARSFFLAGYAIREASGAEEIERLKTEISRLKIIHSDSINALQTQIEILQKQRDELLVTLKSISEYWNGSSNHTAMLDALERNTFEADKTIAAIEGKNAN